MQQAVKLLNFLFQILCPITSALANKLLLHGHATLEDYSQSSEGGRIIRRCYTQVSFNQER